MKKLYCSAEVLVETKRLNASREHEASLRRNYDQVNEVSNKTKLENTLDTQLQRLLNERRAEEQASFEAQMRAEAEIRRKQEEEIRRAEQERARKQAEQEAARRKIEEEAAQRKAAEEQRRAQAEAARQSQEQEAARKKENEVKEKEMAAAKAKADAEDARVKDDQQKAQAAAAQQQQEQQQQKASAAAAVVQSTEYGRKILEVENMEMKKLLAKLKDVRKTVNADKEMYKRINAKKRALNPKLGQLNGETGQTTTVRTFIIQTLTDILKTEANGPMVDAALFQLPRDPRFEAKPPFQVPIAFIWMLNEFGKMVVRQVEAESAVSIKTANPIGVAVVSSLAREALMANGKSFIDIVIARLWKKCPILQGVLGPEDTERQMEGLGWRRVGGGTQWEGDEAHVNRMVGYCAGFSAIAGRNFMNTPTLTNPYPPFNLWFILTHFANHPNQLTNTHFFCIKTMLEVAGDTLKKVYGPQGEKLIRVVMGPLAAVGVKNQVAGAIGLGALAAKYDKDGKFL
ncbi:GLE1-like protein-domain-containing protein [Peziza echinospora]|nr:GLE1-like protein-domain-containing protein [Peziza echinospora]